MSSSVVWQIALGIYDDVCKAAVRLEDFVELGPHDDGAREQARIEVTRNLAGLCALNKSLVELQDRIASVPSRHDHGCAKQLVAEVPRLQVKCSQQLRRIPFHAAQWRLFRVVTGAGTVEEIDCLDRELHNRRTTTGDPRPEAAANSGA